MESFLYGCRRGLPVYKPRLVDVLFDGCDDRPNECLIPADDLNVLDFPIGPNCHCEVNGTRLSGKLWQQKSIRTGDFSRRQNKNPLFSDRSRAKLGAIWNIRGVFSLSGSFVSLAFQREPK